ncbi:response regulator transcription factor [Mucilaginibacter robiniae]|uniref:Response regulator transcription factor n=1 Tax=Mucilaginibacter robiniae TaxID=2728022 RepID=A0A7L5E7E4_9SPHI|nr:LytTR family DNA-binding domain-containing protein [Mucilaginibacter robiniae]QJD98229.1 response regulator transcription factor [Mucilaginibacter robiniae]
MNIIIIEDELRTAKDLKATLENIDPEIIIVDILTSVAAAIKWFREYPAPDLIFSDIQLGDGLSFEIFKEIKIETPVVFCTAFDEYAINAFESNSIDYLLKPIEEDMVERSLQKFKRIKEHYSGSSYTTNLNKVVLQLDNKYKQSFLIHHGEKITPVKVNELAFVYAANGIVTLHTFDNHDYVMQCTIDQMESMLNPQNFFRANRQFILNRNVIQNIEHYFNRRLVVKLQCATPTKIIISRLKAQDFLSWLEQ